MSDSAKRLLRMLDELGRVTDEPGKLTRTFLSPAMRRANRL
ncbi:MAG: hyuC, partial [Lacunisphaera sp.]|nr:hyuC [Lacunisphaera sp.]